MDDYDQVITATFKNEIQIKRLRKEILHIKQLQKEEFKIAINQAANGIHIFVEIPACPQLNSGREIQCLIYLDHRFPFVFPRVNFISHVTKPSLSDGRDYIEDIIHQPWSPSVLLYEIILSLPKFIDSIRQNQTSRDYLLQLGKYHIDSEYDAEIGYEDVQFYHYKEIENGKSIARAFQLSNSYVLMLEYINNQLTLLSATLMKDLIRVDRVDANLVILWRTADENQRAQTIHIEQVDQFIDSLQAYKAGSSGKKIPENEVTMKQYEAINIGQILEEIKIAETNTEYTKQSINELMLHYQKAIEYYSAISDGEYQVYVTRLQNLLSREDVQAVLTQ